MRRRKKNKSFLLGWLFMAYIFSHLMFGEPIKITIVDEAYSGGLPPPDETFSFNYNRIMTWGDIMLPTSGSGYVQHTTTNGYILSNVTLISGVPVGGRVKIFDSADSPTDVCVTVTPGAVPVGYTITSWQMKYGGTVQDTLDVCALRNPGVTGTPLAIYATFNVDAGDPEGSYTIPFTVKVIYDTGEAPIE